MLSCHARGPTLQFVRLCPTNHSSCQGEAVYIIMCSMHTYCLAKPKPGSTIHIIRQALPDESFITSSHSSGLHHHDLLSHSSGLHRHDLLIAFKWIAKLIAFKWIARRQRVEVPFARLCRAAASFSNIKLIRAFHQCLSPS